MFGISNQIAYDGLMVFGTPDRPAFLGGMSGATSGPDARRALDSAEGDELRSVLSQLRSAGVEAAQIRVISPFRTVVGQGR